MIKTLMKKRRENLKKESIFWSILLGLKLCFQFVDDGGRPRKKKKYRLRGGGWEKKVKVLLLSP